MIGPIGLVISGPELVSLLAVVGPWADYLLPVFLIAYTIWWAHTLREGSRINRWTLGLHIAVYGVAAFYVYFISWIEFYSYGDQLEVDGALWMVAALTIAYASVRVGMWYGSRTLKVVRTEAGHWHLRGPVEIAVFWAALYGTRYALENYFLQGFSVLFPLHALPSGVSTQVFSSVVVIVASLYLVSFGFLCGVSIAEWNLHAETARAHAASEALTGSVPAHAPAAPASERSEGRQAPSPPPPAERP